MALRGVGEAAGGSDPFVSCSATEFFGEGHGNGFRVNLAASEFEIAAHSICVDVKKGRKSDEVMQSAGCEADNFGKGGPFSVPGAEAALMILCLCGEDGANEGGDAIGCAENSGASDWILLVGH